MVIKQKCLPLGGPVEEGFINVIIPEADNDKRLSQLRSPPPKHQYYQQS